MKRIFAIICTLGYLCLGSAQTACDSIIPLFNNWEERLGKLNVHDPELISLHYLFVQDIEREIADFKRSILPYMHKCPNMDFYEARSILRRIEYKTQKAHQILYVQKERVDEIFYDFAKDEISFGDTTNALYYLDRSLQYNKTQADALLLKARLMLDLQQYDESVSLIHTLYTEAELSDEQEINISDFTIILYNTLYNVGDSLAKNSHSADALSVFMALEHFCTNMPSGYCNDDYYRGILRSREGVYESYLSIAREAEKRHNTEMARKFYQYAEEYKNKY